MFQVFIFRFRPIIHFAARSFFQTLAEITYRNGQRVIKLMRTSDSECSHAYKKQVLITGKVNNKICRYFGLLYIYNIYKEVLQEIYKLPGWETTGFHNFRSICAIKCQQFQLKV